MSHRPGVLSPVLVGKLQSIGFVNRQIGLGVLDPKLEAAGRAAVVDLHLRAAPPVAVQVDIGLRDCLVRGGPNGYLGPLDRTHVTLPLDDPIRDARVVGVIVGDAVDEDGGGDLDRDLKRLGSAVAGDQVVRAVLLHPTLFRRQAALVSERPFGPGHEDRLSNALAVGRRVVEIDLLLVGELPDLGRDRHVVAVEDDQIAARFDLLERHACRRRDIGPGPKHPGGRREQTLGR